MDMNKKGFTLVELLVTISILGIVTGISIPLLRNVQSNMDIKRYKTYADSVTKGAKLYNDSYMEDLFGHKKTGCAYVKYSELKDKNLVKDIDIKDVSCDTDETYVKIIKNYDKYSYYPFIGCGPVGKDESVNITILIPEKREIQESCDVDA